MAHIHDPISSLKQIRNILDTKGIDRFNSLHEFDTFLENYESEQTAIYQHYQKELATDIYLLEEEIKYNYTFIEQTRSESARRIDEKVNRSLARIEDYKKAKEKESLFAKRVAPILVKLLGVKTKFLTRYYAITMRRLINKIECLIGKDSDLLNEYTIDRERIVKERSAEKIENLAFTKEVVEGLNRHVAGAIGETLVVNEIRKLSDDYILINDFSLTFDPPIYNRKQNDRIYSIQIDHLLISKAGVFILETKNWSRVSINSLDLRSPIEQVRRTGYALYILLNSRKGGAGIWLDKHHWGERRIPIRGIVVMINEKPGEDFKYVKVKTLRELNSYIEFFQPILSDDEFDAVSKALINLYNRNNRTQKNIDSKFDNNSYF